eukprot:15477601-Alexandrium_andersonii.AAC.1
MPAEYLRADAESTSAEQRGGVQQAHFGALLEAHGVLDGEVLCLRRSSEPISNVAMALPPTCFRTTSRYLAARASETVASVAPPAVVLGGVRATSFRFL